MPQDFDQNLIDLVIQAFKIKYPSSDYSDEKQILRNISYSYDNNDQLKEALSNFNLKMHDIELCRLRNILAKPDLESFFKDNILNFNKLACVGLYKLDMIFNYIDSIEGYCLDENPLKQINKNIIAALSYDGEDIDELQRLLVPFNDAKNQKLAECIKMIFLADASYKGNEALIKFWISQGVNVNEEIKCEEHYIYSSIKYPLWVAADAGKVNSISILLDAGANQCNFNGENALNYVACNNNIDAVKALVRNKADMSDVIDEDYISANIIHNAARNDSCESVEFLLNILGVVDVSYGNESTLHTAALYGAVNTVKMLLNRGAKIELEDIFAAVSSKNSNAECFELLLEKFGKIDINITNKRGRTLLNHASENGNYNAIKLILARGGKVQVNDLFTAINLISQSTECFRLLLDTVKSIDINISDRNGLTFLNHASRNGNSSIIELLLKRGAKVDLEDIFIAFNNRSSFDVECFKLLLGANEEFDINNSRYNGFTFLHQAAIKFNFNLVKYLCSQGADVEIKDNRGFTALISVIKKSTILSLEDKYNKRKIVEFLLAKGANFDFDYELNKQELSDFQDLLNEAGRADLLYHLVPIHLKEAAVDPGKLSKFTLERLKSLYQRNGLTNGFNDRLNEIKSLNDEEKRTIRQIFKQDLKFKEDMFIYFEFDYCELLSRQFPHMFPVAVCYSDLVNNPNFSGKNYDNNTETILKSYSENKMLLPEKFFNDMCSRHFRGDAINFLLRDIEIAGKILKDIEDVILEAPSHGYLQLFKKELNEAIKLREKISSPPMIGGTAFKRAAENVLENNASQTARHDDELNFTEREQIRRQHSAETASATHK